MPDTGTDTMTDSDTTLLRQDDVAASRVRGRSWLPVAFAAIALALIAAGASWWFLNSRETIPEWDRLPALDLAAPAGDAFRGDTPWVNLRLMTARPGEENVFRVQITPRTRPATPVPMSTPPARITSLTARPLSSEPASAETLALRVYIAGASDNEFPSYFSRGAESMAEEMRVFYVAITRPKRRLRITWSNIDGYGRPQQISRFIDHFPDHCVERISSPTR